MIEKKRNFGVIENSTRQDRDLSLYQHELFGRKLLVCRSITTEMLGSPNVQYSAQLLYRALYYPESFISLRDMNLDQVEGLDKLLVSALKDTTFSDRIDVLSLPLNNTRVEVPSEEEFVQKVRYAMTSEVDFGKCLSEDARQQLTFVMEKSEKTIIWTDGDSLGVSEYGLGGSREQLKKLATAKFYNLERRRIAKERSKEQQRKVLYSELLSVVAVEGKMALLPQVIRDLVQEGIQMVVIVEDRSGNLHEAIKSIREEFPNLEVFPVWVNVGKYKNKVERGKNLEQEKLVLHAIDGISQLSAVLDGASIFVHDKKVGSIFDLDGTLHDDDLRREIQTKSVEDTLKNKGWIV